MPSGSYRSFKILVCENVCSPMSVKMFVPPSLGVKNVCLPLLYLYPGEKQKWILLLKHTAFHIYMVRFKARQHFQVSNRKKNYF